MEEDVHVILPPYPTHYVKQPPTRLSPNLFSPLWYMLPPSYIPQWLHEQMVLLALRTSWAFR